MNKKTLIIILLTAFALTQLQADDKDKGKNKDKKEQEHKNHKDDKEKKKEQKKSDKENKKDKEKSDKKKDKAARIAKMEKRIAHLKEVADKQEAKGNTKAAAAIREKVKRAEARLAEKKKKLNITTEEIKEAETTIPANEETPTVKPEDAEKQAEQIQKEADSL